MLGKALGSDHWELGDDEAKNLADALLNLQRAYGVSFDPKTQAWVDLITAASAVYGPRVMFHNMIMQQRRKEAKQQAARVDDFEQRVGEAVQPNGLAPAQPNGSFGAPRAGFAMVGEPTHPSQMFPPGFKGASH